MLILHAYLSGAPEAVLDWGAKTLGGSRFFLSGAHQWRSQLFGMPGGGGGTKCIDKKLHIGRAEVFVIIIFLT